MEYTVIFNTGLSIEDTVSIDINAETKEKALEIALTQNPEYCGWNNYIKNNEMN